VKPERKCVTTTWLLSMTKPSMTFLPSAGGSRSSAARIAAFASLDPMR
jgi:hypothetical protein